MALKAEKKLQVQLKGRIKIVFFSNREWIETLVDVRVQCVLLDSHSFDLYVYYGNWSYSGTVETSAYNFTPVAGGILKLGESKETNCI